MSFLNRITRPVTFTILVIVIVLAYALAIQVTEPNVVKLVTSAPKAGQILNQLLAPDLVQKESSTYTVSIAIPIPCGSAAEGTNPDSGPRIVVEPKCAAQRDKISVKGYELGPNVNVTLKWKLPDGNELSVEREKTDSNGQLDASIQARPILATKDGKPPELLALIDHPGGQYVISSTLKDVVNNIFVTIFMALIATTLGTILAIPLSFLAASNITRRGCIGSAVYYVTRIFLNVIRSYEPLVVATILALIVGFGSPFAGALSLAIVTTASLGKMFSESIEHIDPGPIEAVNATGARGLHSVIYAVVPQIIPDFLSYTVYHWDINVRISTIIGFVGGGGIGYYLSQRINTFEYSKAGTALLAIIIVVWALDFLSAIARKKLV